MASLHITLRSAISSMGARGVVISILALTLAGCLMEEGEVPVVAWTSSALHEDQGTVLIGDANGDERVDMTDALHIVNYLFRGDAAPTCMQAADTNDDMRVDLTDAIIILNWAFLGDPSHAIGICVPVDDESELSCEAPAAICPCGFREPEQEVCGGQCFDPATQICVDDAVCERDVLECEPGSMRLEHCGRTGQREVVCGDACTWDWRGPCEGDMECRPGVSEVGGSCGNCGRNTRSCTGAGDWSPWSCQDQGVCSLGDRQERRCGFLNSGSQVRRCGDNCGWRAWTACEGAMACNPGAVETGDGCGLCGTSVRRCTARGEWGAWQCAAEGECRPGAVDSEANSCGGRERECSNACQWGSWSERAGGQCEPGDVDVEDGCGVCGDGRRERTCRNACTWGGYGRCVGGDPDAQGSRCGWQGCPTGSYASQSHWDHIGCGWGVFHPNSRLTCTELCGQSAITVCGTQFCPEGYTRLRLTNRGPFCTSTDNNAVCVRAP